MASDLRPGQLRPNQFELAILNRFADQEPLLQGPFDTLHVFSRWYSGVGCVTSFQTNASEIYNSSTDWRTRIPLAAIITIPGLDLGMQATLVLAGDQPEALEVKGFGEYWDGTFEGFSIGPSTG